MMDAVVGQHGPAAPSRHVASLRALAIVMLTVAASPRAQDRRLVPANDAAEQRRVAFIVGNDSYAAAPLRNAGNDARAIAATLKEVGFDVTLLVDVKRAQFNAGVDAFGRRLQTNDVAIFYYAGHGVEVEGLNYLVPVDYDGTNEAAAPWDTVPLGRIQSALRKAKVSVMILDACRNNPYRGVRGGSGGLAPVEARGSLIAFAAEAVQGASDSPGGTNGLFTAKLLGAMRTPGLGVRELFQRTREQVFEATNGKQFPTLYDGLIGEFVLRPASANSVMPAPSTPRPTPQNTTVPSRISPERLLRVGQTKDEVRRLLGRPDYEGKLVMRFGSVDVYFLNDVVNLWYDPQHVVVARPNTGTRPPFTVCSTEGDVIAVQGQPTYRTKGLLRYGRSDVYLLNGRVNMWVDPDRISPSTPISRN